MFDPLDDGISAVSLIDHMGSDLSVVNAARVSYHKEVVRFSPGEARLLRYLAHHSHWTPFSHPQLQFRLKMPLFVAREWFRHTVGFTRNEVSRRYVKEEPEFYLPRQWREAPLPGHSKQGSGGRSGRSTSMTSIASSLQSNAKGAYLDMVDKWGIAPEMARMVLPVSTYTEFIETASLYAYARLYRLRTGLDAQEEIRKYAEVVGGLIEPRFPHAWKALMGAEDSSPNAT